MARIAGIDIPREKRVESRPDLHLRHRPAHQPEDPGPGQRQSGHPRAGPDRGAGQPAARHHRPPLQGGGRPPPRGRAQHQAPPGDRLLPRPPPPAQPARPRPAHQDQRSPASRSQEAPSASGARSSRQSARPGRMAERQERTAAQDAPPRERKNVPVGHVHVQASFNNTIVTITDPAGGVVSWGSAGVAGFKGSRKSTPYAAAMSRRRRRAPGDGARHAPSRGLRQGSGRRARAGHPLAAGRRARGNGNHRRDAHPA